MKKLISMIMAGALALALAAPALATETAYSSVAAAGSGSTAQSNTMTVAASTNIPAIKLTMPKLDSKSAVIINPYKLTFTSKLNGADVAASAGINAQIISPVFAIKNETQAPLDVTASVQATVGGNLKLPATDPASTDTTNWAQIVMSVDKITNAEYTTAFGTGGSGYQFGSNAKEVNVLTSAQKMEGTDGTIELDAATATVSGTTTTVTPNYLVFQFSGSANTAPKTPWSASDTLSVKVTWNFTPAEARAASSTTPTVTAALTGLTTTAGTLSPTFAAATDTYTINDATSGTAITVTGAADSGYNVTYKLDGTAASNGNVTPSATAQVLQVIVTKADTPTDTKTYTVTITGA